MSSDSSDENYDLGMILGRDSVTLENVPEAVPPRAPRVDKPKRHSQVCRSVAKGEPCRERGSCGFAHTEDELCVTRCWFDALGERGCTKNQLCCFYHESTETVDEYLHRVGLRGAKSQEWVQIRAPRAEIVDAVEAALTNGATRLILNILD